MRSADQLRTTLKRGLAVWDGASAARGATLLIYHRVGGGSSDERDLTGDSFVRQLELLAGHEVVSLDVAMRRLRLGDDSPCVVLTFDDGFADVYDHAWPLLRERGLPFTLYLATAFVGATMHWDGSTAKAAGPALTWRQIGQMHASGLCTVGNHTHTHARPEALTVAELDACSAAIESHLGARPRHFAYPWGIPVPALRPELAARFGTAATGRLGRNLPGCDPLQLRRVPVRRTDPPEFFRAKLTGRLRPERAYTAVVATAKRVGVRA
jgi:peptidoglycan/xylan/chitin deacetylase (PgdA/CDA1 family)